MARGGWRWGAGRPGNTIKAEGAFRVDVRQLHHRGLLADGLAYSWRWSNSHTGEQTGSISITTLPGVLLLRFALNDVPTQQRVPILRTACHYGGTRPWLACPQCHRRVAVIYLRRGRFLCRHCNRVAYRSQSEDALGRSWRRQTKLEARLGENWQRPKGMHHATRARILEGIFACEELRDRALCDFAARLGLFRELGDK